MVFFLLIVVIVFASFMTVLNYSVNLEGTMIQMRELDNEKAKEALFLKTPQQYNGVSVSYTVNNTGTISARVVRLWVADISKGTSGSYAVPLSEQTLKPNEEKTISGPITVDGADIANDLFRYYFVTERGNQFTILLQGGKGEDGANGIDGRDGADGNALTAQVANGIGFIAMDFNSFRTYQAATYPLNTAFVSQSYQISQTKYSAFSLDVRNVDPDERTITLNYQSAFWAINPPSSSGATKGYGWNIAKLSGTTISLFAPGDTLNLPYNQTVKLYFTNPLKPGQNTINTGAAAVNLLLTGIIHNSTHTGDYGQNLPFIAITIID